MSYEKFEVMKVVRGCKGRCEVGANENAKGDVSALPRNLLTAKGNAKGIAKIQLKVQLKYSYRYR